MAAPVSKLIDHTILAADTTESQIRKLCSEAIEHNFCSVCVNGFWVSLAAECVQGSDVKVCAVVGFPLGATLSSVKAFEAQQCVAAGAKEIDFVLNVGALLSGRLDDVRKDIATIRSAVPNVTLKCILETCLLTREQLELAARIAVEERVDFIKTSTGFSKAGAKLEDVEVMAKIANGKCGVKASGGVKTYQQAMDFVKAGATRIGTSSGVAIVKGSTEDAAAASKGSY